jgi:hypothetical protein
VESIISKVESSAMPMALPAQPKTESTRAAEYVRMSTEHLQYSTEYQGDVVRNFAERQGMEIVGTYIDSGKSGLTIDGRNALKQLIQDVEVRQKYMSSRQTSYGGKI